MTWLARILEHLDEGDRSLNLMFGDASPRLKRRARTRLRLLLQRHSSEGRREEGVVYLALIEEARMRLQSQRQAEAPLEHQMALDWYDHLVAKWPYQDVNLQLEFEFLSLLDREHRDAEKNDESLAIETLIETIDSLKSLDARLVVLGESPSQPCQQGRPWRW